MRKNPLVYWHAPTDIEELLAEQRETKKTLEKKEKIKKKHPDVINDIEKYNEKLKKWNNLHFYETKDTFQRPRAMIYDTMLEFNKNRL